MKTLFCLSACAALGVVAQPLPPGPNLARPDTHPYADPNQGRTGYAFANRPVNEFRLYDFYPRQADYYLEQSHTPEIIPAYPGMEAGLFGHWGKYSQFHLRDTRWSQMNSGRVIAGVIRPKGRTLTKGVAVSLVPNALSTCFDPLTLSYQAVWTDGFVRFGTSRWGMMSNLGVDGTIQLMAPEGPVWDSARTPEAEVATSYRGYFRHGDDIVFHYLVNDAEILDSPSTSTLDGQPSFTRTLRIKGSLRGIHHRLFVPPTDYRLVSQQRDRDRQYLTYHGPGQPLTLVLKTAPGSGSVRLQATGDQTASLSFDGSQPTTMVKLYASFAPGGYTSIQSALDSDPIIDPNTKTQGGPQQWPETFTMPGTVSDGDGPYEVDRLPVPADNPYQSMMFLAGLGFFENGDAAVSTFFGDVWLVTGIDDQLEAVRWKRYATGLNQPLGLEIVDGKIHVLGKDQITILHDRNQDQEADYYENFCNRFRTSAGGHDYNTGFQRDAEGNFYFATKHEGIYQITPDGQSATVLATGLRNPNGIGVSPEGRVVTSPQQGQWAPASMIIEAHQGEFYGYPKDRVDEAIAPPLCYIPRGIDNSTGGQLFATSDQWGPFQGQLLSFSFGDCSHYLVLRDSTEGRPQGAVVPLRGEFESGAHRARFHPVDRQLYVVGSQGWGNYAFKDGSFERVRYTGKPVYYPTGFKIHANGIRIDFPQALADTPISPTRDVFCQMWNYQYSQGYGSPEFSVRHPERLGHDRLTVRRVHLLENQRSLFVEIPDLVPAMQVHTRLHVPFRDGTRFATDLYASVLRLGSPFTEIADPAPIASDKPQHLALRILETPAVRPSDQAEGEPGRPITIKAITGLKYDQTFIKVKAGERLSLTLENTDVMPHNWVLVGFEGYTRVGEASVRMLNDPLAFQKQFVPNSRDVIVHTPVANANQSVTIHFNAPVAAGEYPFLCTYPGHWQLMRGTLIVY